MVGQGNSPDRYFPETLDDAVTALADEALRAGAEDQELAELFNLDFTPVPRLRVRRNGWSEERQRLFIAFLARCGCVSRAARAVGMTPRSAYRLLDSPGAASFADAWDKAFEEGIERIRVEALERATVGALVPVYRRGRLVRVEQRRCDRLAIALLGGQRRDIHYERATARSRHIYRQMEIAKERQRATEKARQEELAAAHREWLDRIEEERRSGARARVVLL